MSHGLSSFFGAIATWRCVTRVAFCARAAVNAEHSRSRICPTPLEMLW